jgi:subtilisin family serine protease
MILTAVLSMNFGMVSFYPQLVNATITKKTSFTIAIVDTGIDETHQAFKGRIANGVNLLDYKAKPKDDHGHGTHVAGVIVTTYEKYKNKLTNPAHLKLMPIKALSAEGEGEWKKLAEGIRFAVEKNADLIILSLGLNEDKLELRNAIAQAEAKGVPVIAAVGNDGGAIKYPAAYSSVLAVGGVDQKNQVPKLSNKGEQIDVVAPWTVKTTGLNHTYIEDEGTSMAAPQVAAAVALFKSNQPLATTHQIRQIIRQTTQDVEDKGWDVKSGYGLLRIDRVISQKMLADIYEPNNHKQDAKVMPLGKLMSGQLFNQVDRDWFFIQSPHRGYLSLILQ